jgi:exopolyphosphatase
MKIKEFLKEIKRVYLNSTNLNKVTIVIGNQSADYDSIVSAITLSYFLTKSKAPSVFIPFINSNSKVLNSKKDCSLLFNTFSIDINQDLLFLNDINNEIINNIILVDHNELDTNELKLNFKDKIKSIYDHHIDKQLFLDASPRIVDVNVGSNTTLVAQLFLQNEMEMSEEMAHFMLFPILSDTSYLTVKASQQDKEAVNFLNRIAKVDLSFVYKQIETLKFSSFDENESVKFSFNFLISKYENYF